MEDQTLLSCDGNSYVALNIDTEQSVGGNLSITSAVRDRISIYCPLYSKNCVIPTVADTTQTSDVYFIRPSCSLVDPQGNALVE